MNYHFLVLLILIIHKYYGESAIREGMVNTRIFNRDGQILRLRYNESALCMPISMSYDLNQALNISKNAISLRSSNLRYRDNKNLVWYFATIEENGPYKQTFHHVFSLPVWEDFAKAIQLFKASYYIDVLPQDIRKLTTVCGTVSTDPEFSLSWLGRALPEDVVERCQTFSSYGILGRKEDFVKLRFYQGYNASLTLYEFYIDYIIKRSVKKRGLNYLSKLIYQKDASSSVASEVEVILNNCQPLEGLEARDPQNFKFGKILYRSSNHLCTLISNPGTYNVYFDSSHNGTINNLPILLEFIDNQKRLNVEFDIIARHIELDHKRLLYFFKEEISLIKSCLLRWNDFQIVTTSNLISINKNEDSTCTIDFINMNNGSIETFSFDKNQKVVVDITQNGANYYIKIGTNTYRNFEMNMHLLYKVKCYIPNPASNPFDIPQILNAKVVKNLGICY